MSSGAIPHASSRSDQHSSGMVAHRGGGGSISSSMARTACQQQEQTALQRHGGSKRRQRQQGRQRGTAYQQQEQSRSRDKMVRSGGSGSMSSSAVPHISSRTGSGMVMLNSSSGGGCSKGRCVIFNASSRQGSSINSGGSSGSSGSDVADITAAGVCLDRAGAAACSTYQWPHQQCPRSDEWSVANSRKCGSRQTAAARALAIWLQGQLSCFIGR